MTYDEVIAKALNGRSVYAVAKEWKIPQKTFDRYCNGERLPDYDTALRLARAAGVSEGEMLVLLAREERTKKPKLSYNAAFADVAQSVEQLFRNQ